MPEVDADEIEKTTLRLQRWEQSENGESIADIRDAMQKVMSEDFGVFREGVSMKKGLEKLIKVKERLQHAVLRDKSKIFNTERIEALELDNMMDVAMASAVCAHHRQESRGAHSRIDFPNRDDKKWFKHSLYFQEGTISYRDVNLKPKYVDPLPVKARVE